MKKAEIKELREVTIDGSYTIPDGWQMIKEPVKVVESNGSEVFKIVIGRKVSV